jgi:hypothetical protein
MDFALLFVRFYRKQVCRAMCTVFSEIQYHSRIDTDGSGGILWVPYRVDMLSRVCLLYVVDEF